MSSIWWDEVFRLLADLEQIQIEMEQLHMVKDRALAAPKAEQLTPLAQLEGELAQRLQTFTVERTRLLAKARQHGLPGDSLQALAGAIGGAQQAAALERIELAQVRSARLRRHSWSHWLIAHRCYQHYTEMLELIAHGGQKAPTYSTTQTATSKGRTGVMLNANL